MTPKAVFLYSTLGIVLLTGTVVYNAGAVWVDVREKKPQGEHIKLIVPAIVLPVGARIVPKEKLKEAAEQIRPWLPVIEAASEELDRCPDVTLVQVDSPREHVRITKQGGSLVIDVDDENETVHVSLPIKTLEYTARQIARGEASDNASGPPA